MLLGFKYILDLKRPQVISLKNYLSVLLIGLFGICISNSSIAQCNGATVPAAGLTCADAPILCQIDCLNGFHDTLPNMLIGPQPESLCNGGQPNNMSWFGFVAGSDSIRLIITPSNCTTVWDSMNSYRGIQVGIYDGCDFEGVSEPFICNTIGTEDPIDIGSSDFVIGEIYYLFVDGNYGSVCEYDVEVVFGMQAFEMPEFTTVSNAFDVNFSTDTVCAGSSIEITLDDFAVNAEFSWMIDPPTSNYSSGLHPVNDTSSVTWDFEDQGLFEICVFARNDCDANDTLCFEIFVDTLANEIFSDIEVCANCISGLVLASSDTTCVIGDQELSIPTILTEDPNNDGIAGWLGFTPIAGAGPQVNVAQALYGCTYEQHVNIIPIAMGGREAVTLYRCNDDFPFDYHGTSITGPVSNQFVTLDNAAASGCDSLVSLSVLAYGENSKIETIDCQDGGLLLSFDFATILPAGTTLTHQWFMGSSPLDDMDGNDTTLLVTASGFYSVVTTVDYNGIICQVTRGSSLINLENLSPEAPTFGILPAEVCGVDEVQLYVNDGGSELQYEWTLIPDLPFTFGATTDTISVNVQGSGGFQYSVVAANDCGISTTIVDAIAINKAPSIDIEMSSTICADSVLTITYSGDASTQAIFEWDFSQGTIQGSPDLAGPGPFSVVYQNSGFRPISVTVTDGLCTTEIYSETVEVLPPPVLPQVICQSIAAGVAFSFEDLPTDVTFTYVVSSGLYSEVVETDDGLTFLGVETDSEITIEATFTSNCGSVNDSYSCTSLPCSEITADLGVLTPDGTCLGNEAPSISGVAQYIDGTLVQGLWSGDHVDSNGLLDARSAGIGIHTLFFEYIDDLNCTVTDSVEVEIFAKPILDFEVLGVPCDPLAPNEVRLISNMDGTFTLNDVMQDEGLFTNLMAGSQVASVITAVGCRTSLTFDLEEKAKPQLDVVGDLLISEGSVATFTYQYSADELLEVDWVVNGETVCSKCQSYEYFPQDLDEICVDVTDINGCEFSSCEYLETYTATKVYMPNVFSPNDDGINDTFYPITNNPTLPVVRMLIFDRWGNCVFHQENMTMGEEGTFWDGTFGGNAVASGTYIYVLEYIDESGGTVNLNGDISVVP